MITWSILFHLIIQLSWRSLMYQCRRYLVRYIIFGIYMEYLWRFTNDVFSLVWRNSFGFIIKFTCCQITTWRSLITTKNSVTSKISQQIILKSLYQTLSRLFEKTWVQNLLVTRKTVAPDHLWEYYIILFIEVHILSSWNKFIYCFIIHY